MQRFRSKKWGEMKETEDKNCGWRRKDKGRKEKDG